jgi:hypothetical protein
MQHNGIYPTTLSTEAGEVVVEADANGISTRSVDDLMAAMRIEARVSTSGVSRMAEGLDERVEACRSRTLGVARDIGPRWSRWSSQAQRRHSVGSPQ